MFTLFRRIREKLIASGSVSKYLLYAMGEILLVVIGILIALQINNWNEERKERAEEVALLERLHTEFNQNQLLLLEQIANYELILQQMDRLLSNLGQDPELMPAEEFEELFTQISWIPRYTPFTGTINSILNSGKIGIIRNSELNKLITNWPGNLDKLDYGYQILYDLAKNQHMNFMMSKFPLRNGQIDAGSGGRGRSSFPYDKEELLSSLEVENTVEFKRVDSEYVLEYLLTLEDVQEQIISLIESDLGMES